MDPVGVHDRRGTPRRSTHLAADHGAEAGAQEPPVQDDVGCDGGARTRLRHYGRLSSAWLVESLLRANRVARKDGVARRGATGRFELPGVVGVEGPPRIQKSRLCVAADLGEGLVEDGFENGLLLFG